MGHQRCLRGHLPATNTTKCLPEDPLVDVWKLAAVLPGLPQLLGTHHVHVVPPAGQVRYLPAPPRLSSLSAPPYQASAAPSPYPALLHLARVSPPVVATSGPAAPAHRCRRHRTPQKSGDNA